MRRLVAGARVDGLRAALHEAAQAPFFEAGPPAGRVLEAARDALALLEGAADDEALAGLGRAAAELRETGSASLERSDHVRAGLDHAVAALRAIPDRSIGGWITAAAEAVAAVDPAMPLGLQRARVQDALRSVADAVVVALERAAP